MDTIWEIFSVIGIAIFKVLPAGGVAIAHKMNHWLMFFCIATGNITGVAIFAFFGLNARKLRKQRRIRRLKNPNNGISKEKWKTYRKIGILASEGLLLVSFVIELVLRDKNVTKGDKEYIIFNIFIISALSVLGLTLFTFLIEKFIDRSRGRPLTARKIRRIRRFRKIWKNYGLAGLAFLTPPLISPPIGALLSVTFGEKFSRVLIYNTISALFWALLIALLGKNIISLFP